MKTLLSLFSVIITGSVFGQNLTVTHSKITVSDITADVWSANLNDDMSFYEETFEDFTKQEFGSKSRNDGKNEEILEKVSIPQVTDKRGDLRLTFYTEGDRNKMGLSLLLGYDVWINPDEYPREMDRLRQFTRDYLRFHYVHYYNDIIDEDIKLIDDYEKSIEKSEKSIGTLNNQIARNQERLEARRVCCSPRCSRTFRCWPRRPLQAAGPPRPPAAVRLRGARRLARRRPPRPCRSRRPT
jgi:hypothetical protein